MKFSRILNIFSTFVRISETETDKQKPVYYEELVFLVFLSFSLLCFLVLFRSSVRTINQEFSYICIRSIQTFRWDTEMYIYILLLICRLNMVSVAQ